MSSKILDRLHFRIFNKCSGIRMKKYVNNQELKIRNATRLDVI